MFAREGIKSCRDATELADGRYTRCAGVVLVRQRPGTAKGTVFMTIEDETGIANIVVWPKKMQQYRKEVMGARLVLIEGRVQKSVEGVTHIVAERLIDRTFEMGRLSDGSLDQRAALPAPARADRAGRRRQDAIRATTRAECPRPPTRATSASCRRRGIFIEGAAVARMERSEIRDSRRDSAPDFASLHPGYRPIILIAPINDDATPPAAILAANQTPRPVHMKSRADILKNLWSVAGGDPSALNAVKLTGTAPLLPSSFAIDTAAQVTSPPRALPPPKSGKLRGKQTQDVSVDLEHAVVECRSERYLRRRRQAATARLGCDRRRLQGARRVRPAAHELQASPRQRLQGSGLRT